MVDSQIHFIYDEESSIYQKKFGNRWSWKVTFPNPTSSDLTILEELNGKMVDFKPHDENDRFYESYLWYYYDDTTPYQHKVYMFIERKTLELTASDKPSLTITYPNGGETLTSGNTETITWTSNNIAEDKLIKIDLYENDVFSSSITAGAFNDGSHDWDTTGLSGSVNYKIYIELVEDSYVNNLSDNFTLILGVVFLQDIDDLRNGDNVEVIN